MGQHTLLFQAHEQVIGFDQQIQKLMYNTVNEVLRQFW